MKPLEYLPTGFSMARSRVPSVCPMFKSNASMVTWPSSNVSLEELPVSATDDDEA